MFERTKLKIDSNGCAVARRIFLISSLMIPLIGFNAANAVFKPNEKFRFIIYFDKPSKGIIRYRPRVFNGSAP